MGWDKARGRIHTILSLAYSEGGADVAHLTTQGKQPWL